MLRSKLILPVLAATMTCGAFAQSSTGTTFCTVSPNSTGLPTALLGYFGSGVGSDLHLDVINGVPGEFGYFLVGDEVTSGMMFGNGLNCLVGTMSANIYRYNVSGTLSNSIGRFDGMGVLQNLVMTSFTGFGFDVPDTIPASMPIIVASGSTWHFQVWHRDSAMVSSGSNFSNGLSVMFGMPQVVPGMVSIQAGTFEMGSDAASGSPYFGNPTTQPVHTVSISKDFWMGEHEVTQAEYQALIGTNPSSNTGVNLPVEQVSWNDAVAYCVALTVQEAGLGNIPSGYEYRLPTEAEWEYTCRAGTITEFNVGSSFLCGLANFAYSRHTNSSCSPTGTVTVGSYASNAWGLYDMHGNVSEWCLDTYAGYSAGAVTDPFVTSGGSRVVRGGFWFNDSSSCRSANRYGNGPGRSNDGIGFRVVLAEVLVP